MKEKALNYKNLNGWAISEEAIKWIIDNLNEGDSILEFGSGNGTIELAKFFDVTSVESNLRWAKLSPLVNYVVAPIEKNWFKMDKVFEAIKDKEIKLVIVDAPKGTGNRTGFVKVAKCFKDSIILIDDTNRIKENKLACSISIILDRKMEEFVGKEKSFAVIR